jgi:tetratricopeptide (TPR) repeat protein
MYGRVSPADWARTYGAAGTAALRAGELAAADVYFRRMAVLDQTSPSAWYGLALTAERQDDLPRARELLRRIAPENKAGYPEAHYWLAQDLIRQKVLATPQVVRELEHHLRQALRVTAYQSESRVILAQLYAAGGEPQRAIGELERVVAARPEFQLELSRLYALVGRRPEAVRAATRAGEFFQARVQTEPDQPQHRLRWASSLVLQDRYQDAVDVLAAGLTLTDPQPFRQALAATYLSWFDASTVRDKPQPVQKLRFLERVLHYDPDNERALTMLAELAIREEQTTDQATEILQQVLSSEQAPAMVDLILGTQALHRGDVDQGLKHLEQSLQGNPQMPELLNNLAWGLAHQDEPDLERALQLAEAAQRLSKHPETYDTTGTILAKLGRPREAVSQLETALRVLPPRADLHRTLGDVYEQLGDAVLAGEHRRLAAQLDASR